VGIAELRESETCGRFTIRVLEKASDFVGLARILQKRREFTKYADPDRRSRNSEKRPSIHSIFHFLFPFLIGGASPPSMARRPEPGSLRHRLHQARLGGHGGYSLRQAAACAGNKNTPRAVCLTDGR
jgi:hypothetical protein